MEETLERLRDNDHTLTKLTLFSAIPGYRDFERITHVLKANTTVIVFDVSGMSLGAHYIRYIANILMENTTITALLLIITVWE